MKILHLVKSGLSSLASSVNLRISDEKLALVVRDFFDDSECMLNGRVCICILAQHYLGMWYA